MNLNNMALTVHPKILLQDIIFKDASVAVVDYLKTLSKKEIAAHQRKILTRRFGGAKTKVKNKVIIQPHQSI